MEDESRVTKELDRLRAEIPKLEHRGTLTDDKHLHKILGYLRLANQEAALAELAAWKPIFRK